MVERLKPFTIYVYNDVSHQTGLFFFCFAWAIYRCVTVVSKTRGRGGDRVLLGSIFFFNVENAFFS